MIIEKSLVGFRATVPCKVNLFLEVLGKRDDGYHSLDTVMMAVSLVDELEISPRADDQLTLSVAFPEGYGQPLADDDFAWRIPEDSNNLIIKALDRLRIFLGKPNSGANVRLVKRIPAMAGLGGGSADAAAALALGLTLWGAAGDFEKAKSIASNLGSDVNFFLEGQKNSYWLARCTHRGEVIQPLDCLEPLHFVIVHPPIGCGTAEVFRALGQISWQDNTENPESILNSLKLGCESKNPLGVFNRLEKAAMRTTDWIGRTRKRIDRYNHRGQCMTGSGSARFCLCTTRDQAEKIASELRTNGGMRAYYAQSWQSSGIEEQINRVRNES